MNITDSVWRSLGRQKVSPTEVLNTLIELDNRKGQVGLWALEGELRTRLPRLRPVAQPLAQAWLEAIAAYRDAYYPQSRFSRLINRLAKTDNLPIAS